MPEGPAPARRLLIGMALAAIALLALAATPALAASKINKADFARFINCPVALGEGCLYAETLEGEFKIGSKTTPIVNPTIIQGGLADLKEFNGLPLIPPRFGAEELSKALQELPGGLTGLTNIVGGPVFATAELAGTPEIAPVGLLGREGTAVELPIKVHLENELLGPNCYIGSEAEPIVLHLTDGTTRPPEGIEPMTGEEGKATAIDKTRVLQFIGNKLVDNTFPVPAATGCGTNALLEPVVTAAVNLGSGLPAAAGTSHAILIGNQYASTSPWVLKYDKKLLKEKESPKK
ncbi:MAG TPA: hypothetical protein VF927_02865 [Solirubrobacteraceae bacterium]